MTTEVDDDFSDIDAELSEELGISEQGDAATADPGTATQESGTPAASAQPAQNDGGASSAQPPDVDAALEQLNGARSQLAALQAENDQLRSAQEATASEPQIDVALYTEEEQQNLIELHGQYDAEQMIKDRAREVNHATDMSGLRKQIADLSQIVQGQAAETQLQQTLVQNAPHMAAWRAASQQLPEGQQSREFMMANANLQYIRTLFPDKSYNEQLQLAEKRTLNDLGQKVADTTTTTTTTPGTVSTAAVPDGLGQVAGGGGETTDQALMNRFEQGANDLSDDDYHKLDDLLGFA